MERNRTFKKTRDPRDIPLGLSYDDVLIVPRFSELKSRDHAETTSSLFDYYYERTLGVPVIAANMDTVASPELVEAVIGSGGSGVIHRAQSIESQVEAALAIKKWPVGAAVGVVGDYLDRAAALANAEVDYIVLDIAHGHGGHALEAIRKIKLECPFTPIMAGNIATANGFRDLVEAGADAVKVGVGPGAACTTRIIAGIGVPQLTAIMECAPISQEYNVPLIADGGVKNPGDLCKAIAAGADTVMLGSVFAACPEAPGERKIIDGIEHKRYRGMASAEARQDFTPDLLIGDFIHAEGEAGWLPVGDPAAIVVERYAAGLRSAMSYVGAYTIPEFRNKAEFIRITQAGLRESQPHGISNV